MKRNLKRGISLLLTACLALGIFGGFGITPVHAEDVDTTVNTVISTPNLISNGAFGGIRDIKEYPNKTVPTDWSAVGVNDALNTEVIAQVTDTYAQDGKLSMHIGGTTGKTYHFSKEYEGDAFAAAGFVAGESVATISIWVRGVVSVKGARIGIEFRQSDKSTVVKENGISYLKYIPVGTYHGWTEIRIDIPVPANAAWARVMPIEVPTSFVGDIYVDNASVTIDGGTNILANGSFETMPAGATTSLTDDVLLLNREGWGVTNVASGNVSVVADPINVSNAVLKIEDTSDTNYPAVYYGGVPIEAGASYVFTLNYMVADVDDGMSGTAYLRGNNYSGSFVSLGSGSLKDGKREEWTELKVTIDAVPENVETFYVMLATTKTPTGIMYIDDVTLTKVCNEHIWGAAVVTGNNTCAAPTVSVKTCTNCGATDTTTTSYTHSFADGACSACGTPCAHKAPEGYCTICKQELPEKVIGYNKIMGGDFDNSTGWRLANGADKKASVQDGMLKLWDNTTTDYTTAWYGGIPIEIGKTYTFKLDYMFAEGADADFPLRVILRGNDAWGTGAKLASKDYKYTAGIAGTWQRNCEITFTVTEDMQDTIPNAEDHSVKTFYVMLYTNSAATGTVYVDNVSLVEHSDKHRFGNAVISEADCCTGAVRTVTCLDCGAIGTTEFGEPLEHAWDDGVIDPDLSTSEDVVTIHTCTDCGATKAVTTHANGHKYHGVVTAPTCTTDGYTTYTCECGDSYADHIVKAPGHSFENGKCTVCGDNREFKLLLIGNSYSRDAANWGQGMKTSQLLDILQAMLGEHAEVTLGLAHSGAKGMNWHATQAYQNTQAYTFSLISTANPTWKNINSYTSADALAYMDWDAVSLQPYKLNVSTGKESAYYPEATDPRFYDFETAAEYMLDHVAKYAPGAEVYLFMHWATTTTIELNAGLSQYNQSAAFMPQVLDYAGTESSAQFENIIPVALSIQNARTTYLSLLQYNTDAERLYLEEDAQIGLQRDTGHLSLNVGRYIASLTFAETIISADMRAEGYVLPDIRITESVGKLPAEYTEIAQKSVFAAVNGWKSGSLAVADLAGYTEDPTVAAVETLNATSLTVVLGNADTYINQIRTQVLAALPADFAVDAIEINTDTDTAAVTIRFGYTSATVEMEIVYVQTHDHSWNEGEVTTPASKEETGIMTYTCTVCGEQKTEVIPQTLRFSGGALTLQSNVQVNFNVSHAILDAYGYTDLYAVFAYENREGELKTVTVTKYRKTEKHYVFDFDELAPDLLGNTITATLHAKNNGKTYTSATVEYSVLAYCNRQLPGAANNIEFRTLLVDLLNYGAAAQLYTGYKTDALVNAGLTEEQKSWGSTASGGYVSHQAITGDMDAPLVAWKGGALILEDAVTMAIKLEAKDLDGLSIKVHCGDFEIIYDCAADLVPTGEENRYKLIINELPINTMREPVYVTAYKDGVAVSKLLTYSVESYAASKYGAEEKLSNLLDAMMRYGDAADAYVTSLQGK